MGNTTTPKTVFYLNYSKDFVFGLAYGNKVLQIGLILFIIEVDFSVIKDGLKRFINCFKEN